MDTNADAAPVAGDVASPVSQKPARAGWFTWLQASAHIAEIAGVIVVIVSLFYLSIQIQQNTTQLRRADLNATHEHWSAIRLFIAGNRDHAVFWSAALNGAELDPPDQLRFNALMAENARATFQIWDRNRSITFAADDFIRSGAPPLARLLCTAGGSVWWKQFQSEFPSSFVSDMDNALAAMLAGPGSGDSAHPCIRMLGEAEAGGTTALPAGEHGPVTPGDPSQ